MSFDGESFSGLAKILAVLAENVVPRLRSTVSASLQAGCPILMSEACLAIAAVILEKAIITNSTTPGDIALRLRTLAVKEYEASLLKKRDTKDLWVEAMSTGKRGSQVEYRKNKTSIENAWNWARDRGANPFESMGLITLTYCEYVAKVALNTPDVLGATQSELEAFVTNVRAVIKDA